jgi:uncharacterized protein YcfJ
MLICRSCGTRNYPDPGGPPERLFCGNCRQPTLYRPPDENTAATGGAVLGAIIGGLFLNPLAVLIGAFIGGLAGSAAAKKERKP